MSKKPGKRRWSLTLLYSTAFFLIQLAAVLITAALSFLLTKLGVLCHADRDAAHQRSGGQRGCHRHRENSTAPL